MVSLLGACLRELSAVAASKTVAHNLSWPSRRAVVLPLTYATARGLGGGLSEGRVCGMSNIRRGARKRPGFS